MLHFGKNKRTLSRREGHAARLDRGKRSLYFVLAGVIGGFRYLSYGLALVLSFIGVKMLMKDGMSFPPARRSRRHRRFDPRLALLTIIFSLT